MLEAAKIASVEQLLPILPWLLCEAGNAADGGRHWLPYLLLFDLWPSQSVSCTYLQGAWASKIASNSRQRSRS